MSDLESQLKRTLEECEQLKKENEELRKQLDLVKSYLTLPGAKDVQHQFVSKQSTTQEKIRLFLSIFKGRQDVFAWRFELKDGKHGYAPALKSEKFNDYESHEYLPMSDQVIYQHLAGEKTVGIYPLLKDNTCWFLSADFDKKSWEEDVLAFLHICFDLQVPAYIEKSRSGEVSHLWIFFSSPIPAALARKLGSLLLEKTIEQRNNDGLKSFDRFFPNQDIMPAGGFGNLIALPFQRDPAYHGNSVFVNNHFEPYPDQWLFLSSIKKLDMKDVKAIINNLEKTNNKLPVKIKEPTLIYPKQIEIQTKGGMYLNTANLPSELIDRLIRSATFNNPEFYKAKKGRRSTHGIPRKIDCSENTGDYLILPRGCFDEVKKVFDDLNIKTTVIAKGCEGKPIEVTFNGTLTTKQYEAEAALINHNNGVLSAATGFGKTVVAASLIARRGINTLIIVHRKQLIEQWGKELAAFYNIEPKTFGRIGGGKNKVTGFIDIATIQSLKSKGQVKDIVRQYGQIIVDECHHMSAYSFEEVLKQAEAKYVYGLTATPIRKDGLHPIIFMQLGPICYKVTAKSQARLRPFEHILIPRRTYFRSKLPNEQKTIQNLFEELVYSKERNSQIFDDVLKCLEKRRKPIIITERVEHVEKLKEAFSGFVRNLTVLTGAKNSKESQIAIEKMKDLPEDVERLIIATGKFIGEGFDDPWLDTLFLTMPISWRGTLNQYVGRLHRLNPNKQMVQVYDYIDDNEPLFKTMYEKRLKTYKSMGYEIFSENKTISEQMRLF